MIKFAKNIIEEYKHFSHVYISLLQKGCDGNSLEISTENPDNSQDYSIIETNFDTPISIYIKNEYKEKLDGGFISKSGEKIIFSHPENILTRCGCGKSFSFKSGNEAKDKIAILKAKLKKKAKHE